MTVLDRRPVQSINLPLALASGAGVDGLRQIGAASNGGRIVSTFVLLFLVPGAMRSCLVVERYENGSCAK